ncbi:hypothetical protein NDU88_003116 [Pleurodeles waltl]|uniref:Uncharacterized protein n=1 Tax=Pleurodeles waltl TaxID=8319 RepID=A0AAV7SG47_PLEWA|nr:hypothetical protein NDU88_003116 [Pleurodeles waltl]
MAKRSADAVKLRGLPGNQTSSAALALSNAKHLISSAHASRASARRYARDPSSTHQQRAPGRGTTMTRDLGNIVRARKEFAYSHWFTKVKQETEQGDLGRLRS